MDFYLDPMRIGPGGRRYRTNAVIASQSAGCAFIGWLPDYRRIENEHGKIVADMIHELKSLPTVGNIYIRRNEVEVYSEHGRDLPIEAIDWAVRRACTKLYAEQNPSMYYRLEIRNYWSREFHTDTDIARTAAVYDHFNRDVYAQIVRENGEAIANMVRDLLKDDSRLSVESVLVLPKSITVRIPSYPIKSIWNSRIDDIVAVGITGAKIEMRQPVARKSVTMKWPMSGSVRIFETNFTISNYKIHMFNYPLEKRASTLNELREVGPDGAKLVEMILNINGVVDLFIQPNEIQIGIGKAFSWSKHDIVDAIQKAFTEVFGEGITFTQK